MKNVKQKTAWLWQNAEKVLVVAFFLTFTLNIRKVFLTPYSFLNGGFNEYMTVSFSWADLLMLATIVIYTTKSILCQVINPYYASPSREKVFGNLFTNVSRETFYLLVFLGWTGLSIFWSQYRPISAYRFLTLVEIVLFAFTAVKSLNNAKWLKLTFFAVILNGLFQSLLGIAQFIHNGSLGIRLLGESIVGPNIDGVAKILFHGEKYVRAYGTLPHPNILAGFLLIPLFILFGEVIFRRLLPLYKGETERGSDANHQNLTPALSLLRRGSSSDVPHETLLGYIPEWLLYSILLITGSGFFLTFSRSAFLGLFVGILIFIWQVKGNHYILSPFRKGGLRGIFLYFLNPSPTLPLRKGESRKHLTLFLYFTALLIFALFIIKSTSFLSSQSLQERTLYQNVSYETILKHPLAGVGAGQFVMNEYQSHPNLESWQYQPAHNTYLLLFSELGTVGLIAIALFLTTFFFSRSRGTEQSARLTNLLFCCVVFSFLLISFFDHYFWDIKSGTLIFVLPFVLIFALAMNSKKCSTDFFGLL